MDVIQLRGSGPFQISYPASVYTLHSTPEPRFCAPVQMSPYPLHTITQARILLDTIILAHFTVRGDRESEYPGDMSAILIYERLENVDGIRMTLCSIPFIHDYLPGHRSHAVIVTFNKSACTILCCLVTAQVRGGFQ